MLVCSFGTVCMCMLVVLCVCMIDSVHFCVELCVCVRERCVFVHVCVASGVCFSMYSCICANVCTSMFSVYVPLGVHPCLM